MTVTITYLPWAKLNPVVEKMITQMVTRAINKFLYQDLDGGWFQE